MVHSSTASPDLRASPDNRLPRTDSLACSLAGSPRLHGQLAAQDGLTRPQPRRISAQLRTTTRPGRTHSPAAPPDHSAHLQLPVTQTPRRQYPAANAPLLPTIWPARFFNIHINLISPLPSSAGFQHCLTTIERFTHSTLPGLFCPITSLLRRLVMWEHPHGALLRSHHSSPSLLNSSTIDREAVA